MMRKKGLRVLMIIALAVCMLVTSSVSIVTPVQAADEEFQIGAFFAPTWAYTNATQYDYLRDANINLIQTFYPNDLGMSTIAQMNTVLDLAGTRGIKVQVSDSRSASLTTANIDAIATSYKNHSATGGYYIKDEPALSELQTYATAYRRFLLNDPDSVPNVNLLPYGSLGSSYGQYVNGWIDAVGSDNLKYLTYDHYPYAVGGTIGGGYYQNMAFIRSAGLSRNIKIGCYLQSVGLGSNLRRPNGNEVRLDAYTSVAYGMKALYWFTWFQPVITGFDFTPAIIDRYGNKTDLYTPVQTINGEIKKLGPTLMGLTSRDVFVKGARPAGTTLVPDNYFWQPTTTYNQIISHFTNGSGRSYVMVVNRDYTNSRTLSFNLPSKPSSVTEVSKSTGAEVATNYSNSTGNLSASFLPGEGRLFAISNDFTVNTLTIDDKDYAITYTGGHWGYGPLRGVGDYDDDVSYTSQDGEFFQYSFIGTGIDFVSEKSPGYGNIDFYIDGVFQQTVSCVGPINNQPLQTIYSKTGLPYGIHTIKGIKRSGSYMVVDTFKVYTGNNTCNVTRTNDTSSAVSYTGSGWGYSSGRGVGNYRDDLHYTTVNNDYFQYTFTGTSVNFVSERSPGYGDIDIYIDGVFQQTINCNGTINNQPQQVVYSKTGLAYGAHTLKAVKKSGTYMVVDGF